jgi:hypothetical protein
MRLIILPFAVLSASCVIAEEKPAEIPLKEVWAWGMPGTKSIHELDPQIVKEAREFATHKQRASMLEVLAHKLKDKSLVYRFFSKLKALPEDKRPSKGFVVSGTGLVALRNAVTRLGETSGALLEGEVTLVFFTREAGVPVHLKKVSRCGNKIDIRYVLGSHDVDVRTDQIAMIPLGKLASGTYEVDIQIAPPHEKSRAFHKVCDPFSFTAEER